MVVETSIPVLFLQQQIHNKKTTLVSQSTKNNAKFKNEHNKPINNQQTSQQSTQNTVTLNAEIQKNVNIDNQNYTQTLINNEKTPLLKQKSSVTNLNELGLFDSKKSKILETVTNKINQNNNNNNNNNIQSWKSSYQPFFFKKSLNNYSISPSISSFVRNSNTNTSFILNQKIETRLYSTVNSLNYQNNRNLPVFSNIFKYNRYALLRNGARTNSSASAVSSGSQAISLVAPPPFSPASIFSFTVGTLGLLAAMTFDITKSALKISDFVSIDLFKHKNVEELKSINNTKKNDWYKFDKDSHFGEFLFGSFSGLTSKFIEHPFDTIKVQLQTQPEGMPSSVVGVTRTLIDRYGWRSLFAGISPPLLSSVGEHAILFMVYTATLPILQPKEIDIKKTDGENYSYWNVALSGGIAGAFAASIMTPLELIKCKMQVSQQSSKNMTSATSVFMNIIRENGIRGLYTGGIGTLLRESSGGAAWFGFYELVTTKFTQRRRIIENNPEAQANAFELMAAGSCAGIAYNLALFPADTIKAVQQTEEELRGAGHKSSTSKVMKDIWMKNGVKGFYRGLGITLFRSIPSSALIIMSYNLAKRHFTKED